MQYRAIVLHARPYAYEVYVRQCSPHAGERWLARYGCSDRLHDYQGFTWIPGDGYKIFVWLAEDADTAVVSHELVHVAVEVLRGSGVPLTYSNDESLAYLQAHLLADFLKKHSARKKRAALEEALRTAPY